MENGNISIVRGNKHTLEKLLSAERWESFLFTAKRKTKREKVLHEMRWTDRMLAWRNRRVRHFCINLFAVIAERNYLFIYMCSWKHVSESGIVRYYALTSKTLWWCVSFPNKFSSHFNINSWIQIKASSQLGSMA